MPTQPYTDEQLLEYSGVHLLYEFEMFRWVRDKASSEEQSSFTLSALLESFVVHLRGLTDFFYPRGTKREDDLLWSDFLDSPDAWNPGVISQSLKDARERADKEISHITYKRKDSTDKAKQWPVSDLFNEIDLISKRFARVASNKKLHSEVVKFLTADAKTAETILATASTLASNTCAQVLSTPRSGKNTH